MNAFHANAPAMAQEYESWPLVRHTLANDTAGHDAGDRVLIKLADTLKCSVRAVDLVSRMGGEEFAVILIDSNREGAARAAESIRASVESMTVEGWTALHGPITVSIGCARNDGQSSFEETIKLADEALYSAKENGRNQVVFSDRARGRHQLQNIAPSTSLDLNQYEPPTSLDLNQYRPRSAD